MMREIIAGGTVAMSTPIRSATPRPCVLVVDDETMLRRLLARILDEAGFDVVEAENGEVALAAAASGGTGLQLVVTDVSMPVMSGIEFAREFRPRWPRVPILFITGKDPDPREGLAHSWGELLRKPFGPDVFLATVLRVLESETNVSRSTA
jgi:DNA-binding response OmpR family regulator